MSAEDPSGEVEQILDGLVDPSALDVYHATRVYDTRYVLAATGAVAVNAEGTPGEGVPAGGSTDQVLAKASDVDFDTEWVAPGGGSQPVDSLLRADLLPVIASVPHANDAAVSPDGSLLYVTNLDEGTVTVIDTATQEVTDTITVGAKPYHVIFSPDGATAYTGNYNDGEVSVIDVATGNVTDTWTAAGANGLAISPDGTLLYVSDYDGGEVNVLDTSDGSTVDTWTVGTYPESIALSPDGSALYVGNDTDDDTDSLMRLNTTTGAIVWTTPVAHNALGIVTSPDGSVVYCSEYGSGTVTFFNAATGALTHTVTLPSIHSTYPAITPDGSTLYVARLVSPGKVDVIDTTTAEITLTLTVGVAPNAVAINPVGARAYVANYTDGTVSTIVRLGLSELAA